jgi:hypothetical protein
MIAPRCRLLIASLALLTTVGCQALFAPTPKGRSPLAPAQMSADCCVLDAFFVNVPFGDVRANDDVWHELDEQRFPAELRRRLANNGFRIGQTGGQIPTVLSQLMELNDKPAPTGDVLGENPTEVAENARVTRRHIQTRPGERSEINASGIYDQLPVLFSNDAGSIGGETYEQAQAVLAVKTFPQPDGQVRLEITPEVQHGQPKNHFVLDTTGGGGHIDISRAKRVFTELITNATLAPGSMIVMSSLPDRAGSLGQHFFADKDGKPTQKLLIIRLSGTSNADLLDSGDTLTLPDE